MRHVPPAPWSASPGGVDPAPFASDPAALTGIRARHPELVRTAALRRRRRPLLEADGRMMLIAADHPARGSLAVRDDPLAMGSRSTMLERLVTALDRPGVDGVLGTPDLLEDLLLLGALEGKVVVGSMNRGGLHGSTFELDGRMTGYDAAALAAARFDGGKVLTRIALDDPATVPTLTACADAVTGLAGQGLMAVVEPVWCSNATGRVVNDLDPDSVVRSIHVASALGTTSAHTWLTLPVVAEMERVLDASTMPTLLLGGDPTGHPEALYAGWQSALALPQVRGLVVGRSMLYPPDGDVARAVDTAVSLVR